MNVMVAAGGTWHAPFLAAQLHRKELLQSVVTSTPPARYRRRAEIPFTKFIWNPLPELVGPRMPRHIRQSRRNSAELHHAEAFDRQLSWIIRIRSPELLVVFATFGLQSLKIAREIGIKSILERGSSHVLERKELLENAFDLAGEKFSAPSASSIDRELAEYEAADYISVPSAFARASFEGKGVDRRKMIQVPYGVDTDRFRPNRAMVRRPRSILSVGNLGFEKGTHLLIQAVARLGALKPELSLVGPLDERMERYLRRLPRTVSLRILGPLTHDRAIVSEYQSATVFSLPSIQEGQSLAVLEALACETPAVVSDHCGYDATVGGLVVTPTGSISRLESALHASLSDHDGAEVRLAAREFAERSSWDNYGDTVAQSYSGVE